MCTCHQSPQKGGNGKKVIVAKSLVLPCHAIRLWEKLQLISTFGFLQFFINISSGDYPGPLCWHYFMKQIKKWEGKNISLVFSVPGHQRVGEIMVNFHLQALPTFSQQFLLAFFVMTGQLSYNLWSSKYLTVPIGLFLIRQKIWD